MRLNTSWKWITVVASDVVLIALSYYAAYLLRFNFAIPEVFYRSMFGSLPLVLVVRVACFHLFGLYKGVWRFASANDLVRVLKAATVSSLLIFSIIGLWGSFIDFSRSVFIIDWFIIVTFIGGSRFLYRLSREFYTVKGRGRKVLIVGAGGAGEMILREMKQNPAMNYDPVGFLDDDPGKKGKRIHNVPVLGPVSKVERVVRKKNVEQIIIAIASLTGREMREITGLCEGTGIPVKTVPAVGDILDGSVRVSQLRDIRIEDLLGREHIKLDQEQIREYLTGKRVLVTGAGGSIGTELCRQILRMDPAQLVLLERGEFQLYQLEMEFAELVRDGLCVPVLGDIQDMRRLEGVMEQYRPQVVFHAAAYKHVPMMESHPIEAVKNNILGTRNVAEMSIRYGVEKFVMISTDKAVKPTSVMGASKRISELVCQGMNRRRATRFVAVRFGNVLNSAGSVIPLFKEQIARGGPMTVTDPDITRYFMSIPEASQLVMQAGAMGRGGEIYVLEMGEPVRIVDLATDMARLMGLRVGEDIEIVYTGLRPGEKMFEELVTDEEEARPTGHEKIMMVKIPAFDPEELDRKIDELKVSVDDWTPEEIRERLLRMIPGNGF